MPAQSPKVLELSNQSDELLYNVDLVVKQKGIVDSSILQPEESKDAIRDAQMSHAQDAITNELDDLMDDEGQTRRPGNAEESAATDSKKKKQKKAGNFYRKQNKAASDAARLSEVSQNTSQVSLDDKAEI